MRRHHRIKNPKEKDRDTELSLFESEVTIPLGVEIDIRDENESYDDEPRKEHARKPRIVIDQHLLQPQKIPGGFRRVRSIDGVGGLLQRSARIKNRPNEKGPTNR